MLIFLVEVVVLGYNQVCSKNLSFSFSILPYFSKWKELLLCLLLFFFKSIPHVSPTLLNFHRL